MKNQRIIKTRNPEKKVDPKRDTRNKEKQKGVNKTGVNNKVCKQ
jgi:hypothetical protein